MGKKTIKQKLNSVGAYSNTYMLNYPKPVNVDYRKQTNQYVNTKNNMKTFYSAKNSPSYSTQITGSYLYKTISNDVKDYVNNWSITIKPKDVINIIGLMI
jgi:hypothetical protein